MLLVIDNYDSFTYNLVQLFYEFDLEVLVFRHDAITLEEIEVLKPRWLCISPGPKAPAQAGISKEMKASDSPNASANTIGGAHVALARTKSMTCWLNASKSIGKT